MIFIRRFAKSSVNVTGLPTLPEAVLISSPLDLISCDRLLGKSLISFCRWVWSGHKSAIVGVMRWPDGDYRGSRFGLE